MLGAGVQIHGRLLPTRALTAGVNISTFKLPTTHMYHVSCIIMYAHKKTPTQHNCSHTPIVSLAPVGGWVTVGHCGSRWTRWVSIKSTLFSLSLSSTGVSLTLRLVIIIQVRRGFYLSLIFNDVPVASFLKKNTAIAIQK